MEQLCNSKQNNRNLNPADSFQLSVGVDWHSTIGHMKTVKTVTELNQRHRSNRSNNSINQINAITHPAATAWKLVHRHCFPLPPQSIQFQLPESKWNLQFQLQFDLRFLWPVPSNMQSTGASNFVQHWEYYWSDHCCLPSLLIVQHANIRFEWSSFDSCIWGLESTDLFHTRRADSEITHQHRW